MLTLTHSLTFYHTQIIRTHQLTAQQLIQQAALKQMNSLPAPAPTPAVAAKQPESPLASQRLAQYPAPAMPQVCVYR